MADQKQADCVKVAIRCRPPSQKELNNNEHSIVELQEDFTGSGDGQVILTDPSGAEEPAKFAFDIVFGLSIQQETVYESVGKTALQKTFEGYNGTIFAYGQTGSGKSWSMAGAPKPPELRGITPRMNESLFERIAVEQVGTRKFLVMCSYFEIYNEIIFDLLNPVQDRGKLGGGLQIKEHPVMGIYVKDLTEIVAESAEKLEEMLDSGQKSRAVSATMMNSVSSRSHSIFTIKVHQKDLEDKSKNVFAKLNLVDLAGSERQKGTGATGQTLKEGANINKSLSALGNVINALVECANGKKVFIPYRNSKLTRVLQESLGGNSLCTMLATLSPAACNYEETMSTLRYANRAKAIKVTATKNEEASQISRLKSEVEALKAKLDAAAQGGGGGGGGLTEAEREAEKATFERQLREMEKMMNNNWEDKAKISEEHHRKMQRLVEEQQRAAQAVEEERARRFRLLQEKNDLELTVRGFIDLVLGLPKFQVQPPGLLTGEQPRQWLKFQRSLRQHLEELSEQRTMALVFRHAFDEDIKLCGEGAQADDMSLAAMGISRCLPKLDKLRKGGEKMLTLELEGLNAASELAECVRQSAVELAHFRGELAKAQTATDIGSASAEGSANDNQVTQNKAHERIDELDQVSEMLTLVQKQAHERIDELVQLATIEMGHTCEIVLQFSRTFLSNADSNAMANIQVLEGLIADPSIASLPPGMPAKPLHQYGAADVSDTAETTEALLSQLVHLESFCGKTRKSASELLARPPPKFILDIACALKAATGFPPDIDGDWPEAREERLARLRRLADTIGEVIGMPLDFFDPADVLKGKEVPKTLRLLQLLAVAAAKTKATAGAEAAASPGKGLTRARELSAMLDVIDRCLRGTKEQVETRRASAGAAATGDGSGMEEMIRIAEEQLQEAARGRVRQEEALAGAERELQQSQAEVKKVENECKLNEEGPSGPDAELQELEQQVNHLQSGTANLGNTEAVLEVLSKQLEQVKAQLSEDDSAAQELQAHYDELQAALTSAQEQVRHLEAEAQRERARCETEQELAGQTPEEQKLILAAHEQKLRTRVGTLEAQIGVMHAECEERKGANSKIIQERKELGEKAEESLLQIQIVEEERDSLREAMEQLWKEKDAVEQELQDMQQSYIDLSERVNLQQDELSDQQTVVERKRAEVAGLQKNGFHSLSAHNGNGQAVVAAA